jgi:putative acetyltransferase
MNTTTTFRTSSDYADFIALIKHLDAELNARYGKNQTFFDQYNQVDKINHVVVAHFETQPVGCAAIKQFDDESTEIKRMFVRTEFRGKGIATMMLTELERWARELGYKSTILETGKKQPEAISLYQRCGYQITENYEPYCGIEQSVCMKKALWV